MPVSTAPHTPASVYHPAPSPKFISRWLPHVPAQGWGSARPSLLVHIPAALWSRLKDCASRAFFPVNPSSTIIFSFLGLLFFAPLVASIVGRGSKCILFSGAGFQVPEARVGPGAIGTTAGLTGAADGAGRAG